MIGSSPRIYAVAAAGAAALTALSVVVAPAGYADHLWGSCAVPSNPQLAANAFCLFNGFPAQADAEGRAMDMCNYLKNRQCHVVVSYKDCGAVAQGGDQWVGGTGPTQQAAEQAATSQLAGSTVRKWGCVAEDEG